MMMNWMRQQWHARYSLLPENLLQKKALTKIYAYRWQVMQSRCNATNSVAAARKSIEAKFNDGIPHHVTTDTTSTVDMNKTWDGWQWQELVQKYHRVPQARQLQRHILTSYVDCIIMYKFVSYAFLVFHSLFKLMHILIWLFISGILQFI